MFDELLCHTVTVYRRSGKVDRFGQPVDVNPGQHSGTATSTCKGRLYSGSGGLTMKERSIDVFEETPKLITGPDADINEDDAVKVTDTATGEVLLPITKIKLKSSVHAFGTMHHLEFDLWSQRGPH